MYGCVLWIHTFGGPIEVWMCFLGTYLWYGLSTYGRVPLVCTFGVAGPCVDVFLGYVCTFGMAGPCMDVSFGYVPLVWPVHIWTCPFGTYLWCGRSMRGCVSWVRMYLWYGWSTYGCVPLGICTFGMAGLRMAVSLGYVPLVWPNHVWMCPLGMYLWYGLSTYGCVLWLHTFGMA